MKSMGPRYAEFHALFKETVAAKVHSIHEKAFVGQFGIQLGFVKGLLLKDAFLRGDCGVGDSYFASGGSYQSRASDSRFLLTALSELMADLTRFNASRSRLTLTEVSPTLSQWDGTVHFPGGFDCSSFGRHIQVLRTKTKPKRMRLVAPDGTVRHVLLKAGEDLRIDERIVQCLRFYSAKTYVVAPIANNCGIIEIVPNLKSLFDLFPKSVTEDSTGMDLGGMSWNFFLTRFLLSPILFEIGGKAIPQAQV